MEKNPYVGYFDQILFFGIFFLFVFVLNRDDFVVQTVLKLTKIHSSVGIIGMSHHYLPSCIYLYIYIVEVRLKCRGQRTT